MFLVSICRRGIVGVTVELRHLRYFVAVAEAENVLRAATQKLHVSQPAVSRQIRDLEDELGVQLFERTGKAVSLTDAGRVFLREARAVLERTDEAVKNVRAFAQTGETELHVGYSPLPGAQILPVVLRAFQQAMPDVHRSEEHTSELQSQSNLVCRLLLEKKKQELRNDYLIYTVTA